MYQRALNLITENKARHAQGKDARTLDLGNCGLTKLPSLYGLKWLETLIVSNRWLDRIQVAWTESQNEGPDNKLVAVSPESLPQNLKVLILGGDHHEQWKISNWDFLRKLTQLQFLDLSYNQISNGDFLKNLTLLQSLDLTYNEISNGDFLKNLTQLQSLDFNGSQISNWDFLKNLTQLQSLTLSFNKISNGDFLKNLTQLQSLDLHDNQISNGDFLKNLTQLQFLDLRNNQISNLEPFLPLIKKGISVTIEEFKSGINLYENPLTHPPAEVVSQGNAAILRYFEDLEKSGSDQIYEAKLLLIGEGGAGKTSLCRKLFDPNAPLPQEKDRTRGIDIQPLYFDVPGMEGKQFRLNIWDFAGQGKYQSAHSFFYTHRSLYVFVDDTRTLNENDAYRTLYNNWLQTAELFGGQSPVLVLHNEKDGCARLGFSIGSFKDRFDFVHGELFRINLGGSDTAMIKELRHQIERRALSLPHIGDTVPKTWVKVREAIEAERADHPYISIERYRALCAAEDITDPDKQSDLSQYFHDLGVFLHFPNNPLLKRDVFLQNQWVTDAVYKILDDPQIASEQRGRFTSKDLARLWNEGAYRERRDELLELMRQFELCYQVQDMDTYVCPQLLPGDVPAYDLGKDVPLQLKYEYAFMPKGLFYRLIVRLHRHIAQQQTAVWNSGAVLERAGSKADIIESLDQRTISVRATGLRAKELVTIINEEMERLHAPFGERLRVAVKIPCNCKVCKENTTPHFYDKTNLEDRIENGKTTVECEVKPYENVDVKGLLDGVFEKNRHFSPEDIQALFKSGKTEDALKALCESSNTDAAALLGRFSEAHRKHSHGLIDFEEFEKVSAQVRTAGLKLLE